jgi:hypothetical protein
MRRAARSRAALSFVSVRRTRLIVAVRGPIVVVVFGSDVVVLSLSGVESLETIFRTENLFLHLHRSLADRLAAIRTSFHMA